MKRICFVLQVKPNRLEEYKERHRAVWPELQIALDESGWRNYSLFLRPDGLLIGYLETEDFDRARVEMARREVNLNWQREMSSFFVQPDGLHPDSAIQPLEEVFHLNGRPKETVRLSQTCGPHRNGCLAGRYLHACGACCAGSRRQARAHTFG